MRSEDSADVEDVCNDPLVQTACLMGSDKCPAACQEKEDNTTDDEEIVVKSGDLAVKAEAASNRKVIVPGTSDLDTLTFKTSEEVSISKVTLERYGYSSSDDVYEVRLEDDDGNVIADAKGLTKDKANLTIKKDYRTVDGTFNATVVVTTTGNNAGGTLGFKVTGVESTAKNLNLNDYSAYTYDMVTYSGAVVKVDVNGTDKDYNYEEGSSYEVARLKVSAGSSDIYVKGFTLTNGSGLDMGDFLDELTVKVDGENVKGLKYSVNKDDELVISFDDIVINMNKNATFVVSASFEEFDDYGEAVAYYIAEDSDFNAVEKKTSARLTVTGTHAKANAKLHTFNGGKIKISNTKLGNVDASQASEGVVVAEGNITITEPLNKVSFTINANNTGVEAMTFVVNGEEYEGKKAAATTGYDFTFSNIEIEKSGKVQFTIDILDDDSVAGDITFSPAFNKNAFDGAKYETSNKYVSTGDVAGSVSFSKVTIQAARASLKNDLTKDVEFLKDETNRKTVFEGTYTAKKALVYLNSFYMTGAPALSGNTITYYLSIDGEEVADTDVYGSGNKETFSDVKVKAGESVKVKVEAEVEAYGSTGDFANIYVVLGGEDDFGKDIEEAKAKIRTIKVKESGSVVVSATADRNTVLLKANNAKIAEFVVKPSNDAEGLVLDDITFSGTIASGNISSDQIVVYIDGVEEEVANAGTLRYEPAADLPVKGITVKVELDEALTGEVVLQISSINGKTQTRTFNKRYEEALVYVASQEDLDGSTRFILAVEKEDSDTVVSNLIIKAGSDVLYTGTEEVVDGDDIEIINNWTGNAAKMIDSIAYDYEVDGDTGHVEILKTKYNDYFKVGSTYAKVFKAD